MDRRQYLGLVGAVGGSAFAGCTSGDGTATDDDGTAGDDPDTNGESDESSDEQPPSELDQETLELGETVLFYTEDGSRELSFRPVDPVVRPLLVTDRQGQGLVATDVPASDSVYLTVVLEAENVGEAAVDVPSTVDLHVDGATHSHVRTALTDEYEPFQELEPGESMAQYAVFEVPEERADAATRLTAEWGARDSVTAEWSIDLADARREELDVENLQVGEAVTIGTDEVRFALTVEGVGEVDDGDETSVFVTVSAENVGQTTVMEPTVRGVSLVADGDTFDPESDDHDGRYESGELEPGASKRGDFHFRVPASADLEAFRVTLTPDLDATWDLQ